MSRALICFASLALVACATLPDPGARPQRPPPPSPAGVDWAQVTFTGAHGLPMYAQRWRPVSGEPRAVVAIHHGLADHSSRYAGFAARLVAAGYTVWAFDMRGHGRSAGPRVAIDRADDALDDLDAFLAVVRAEEPGRKIFLYGHSLGGLFSGLYTIERQPDLSGLILASPGLAIDDFPILAGGILVSRAVAPDLGLIATPHRDFSRRDEVVAEMDRDPLISRKAAPARTARTALDAIGRVWAAPERLRVPLLVIHGTGDKITAPAGSRDLVARAGSSDRTLRLYEGFVHDLLREPEGGGEQVIGEVITWLDEHSAGTASSLTSTAWNRPLRGDRHGEAFSIQLDARGELPRDGDAGATGGLRLRVGWGRTSTLGLGYLGGLDVRGGVVDGEGLYELDAHLLGLVLRARSGAFFAITGGAGIGGLRGAGATHAPLEVSVEVPLGGVRMLARGGLAWRLGGDEYPSDVEGVADEASALVGVRLGRDRRYWSAVSGGAGPFVALGYRNLGGLEVFGLVVGLDLWGGN